MRPMQQPGKPGTQPHVSTHVWIYAGGVHLAQPAVNKRRFIPYTTANSNYSGHLAGLSDH